ncbi:hypothetical protein EVAR_84821_1 [Eumeta japonica]|uniref:Uncharacterized protein n=1 Tax=Eumeta variegata TaxID=151549 RepID=A0A4C1U8A7_EUMVA|nr:hypothetical protein EVAR_84821_1 [Eumeta japonica]
MEPESKSGARPELRLDREKEQERNHDGHGVINRYARSESELKLERRAESRTKPGLEWKAGPGPKLRMGLGSKTSVGTGSESKSLSENWSRCWINIDGNHYSRSPFSPSASFNTRDAQTDRQVTTQSASPAIGRPSSDRVVHTEDELNNNKRPSIPTAGGRRGWLINKPRQSCGYEHRLQCRKYRFVLTTGETIKLNHSLCLREHAQLQAPCVVIASAWTVVTFTEPAWGYDSSSLTLISIRLKLA